MIPLRISSQLTRRWQIGHRGVVLEKEMPAMAARRAAGAEGVNAEGAQEKEEQEKEEKEAEAEAEKEEAESFIC